MENLNEIVKKYLDTQKIGDTKTLTKLFQELISSRNLFAVEKGYVNYPDMQEKFNRISEFHIQKYLDNRNVFAEKYSPKLIDSPNSPHFLSKLPKIEMTYPQGVIDFVAKKYPEIKEIEDEITIETSDKGAHFVYQKDSDDYLISIPKTNSNQKISMFIHELSHVVSQEKHDHKIEGYYQGEIEAHEIEFELAKDISENFFQAVIGEYLKCLVRTDFLYTMFTNENLDPVTTYTKAFAKYVGKLNPENKTDFLFDKNLTHFPLSDMTTSVSLVNLLT